jgi:hypothetical protein
MPDQEIAIRVFKCRSFRGYDQDCQICEGPISFQQQIVITNSLRTVHLGCLAYKHATDKAHRMVCRSEQPSLFEEKS